MTIKEVINQLESLKADAVERIDPEDEDDMFKKDAESLNEAIKVLKWLEQGTEKGTVMDGG